MLKSAILLAVISGRQCAAQVESKQYHVDFGELKSPSICRGQFIQTMLKTAAVLGECKVVIRLTGHARLQLSSLAVSNCSEVILNQVI